MYLKYKSGWIEQGGIIETKSTKVTVQLPVEMSNANYYGYAIVGSSTADTDGVGNADAINMNSRTTTSFDISHYSGCGWTSWYVFGD